MNKFVKARTLVVPVLHPLSAGSRHPVKIYLIKVNNRNTTKSPETVKNKNIRTS